MSRIPSVPRFLGVSDRLPVHIPEPESSRFSPGGSRAGLGTRRLSTSPTTSSERREATPEPRTSAIR
ncbi:hypothetical protein EYF80_050874 [Liparis tanakae]|uniref:Uncharacterized protein n=1 Tax=Liparis tanakae TaxID=230148 RepID=A0A4Z2FCQ5_9TELE|nr:hypothetical protein EYF80_050874 [Liparis tanakae]